MNRIKWLTKNDLWIVFLDIIAVNLSYYLAIILRFYVGHKFYSSLAWLPYEYRFFTIGYTVFCITVFILCRLYSGMWRYAGIHDMNRIIGASIVTTVGHVLGTLLFFKRLPITVYVLGATLQFIFICLIRFSYRLVMMELHRLRDKRNAVNALVIGIGDIGRIVLHLVEESTAYRPIAVIDTTGKMTGNSLDGMTVYGEGDIERVFHEYDIQAVFIGEPDIGAEFRKTIRTITEEKNIELIDNTSYLTYIGDNESVINVSPVTPEGKKIIPFSPPDISSAEIEEVVDTLKSGWITTGPRVKRLERRLAAYIETGRTDIDTEADTDRWKNRLVCLSSATAAEELNLRILGIGPGDEVLVPAYTYTASASAVIHCGATVRFIDIQKDGDSVTGMPEMDYTALENAITEKTKAIVVVDLGGIVADYETVYKIVENKKERFTPKEPDGTPLGDLSSKIQKAIGRIAVIADDAHSLGASRIICGERKYCGAIADFTSFSFHAVKNFTTAEGGASTWKPIEGIDNAEIYKFYQLLSLHGQSKDALAKTKVGAWEYDIIGPWYKCNMTDIMAAIGLKQLDRYPALLKRREEIIRKYDRTCDELGLKHLYHHTDNMDSSNHLYLVRIPGATAETRNRIIEEMAKAGVITNVHYKPLPMMTAYKDANIDNYPNACEYYENLVSLPLHTRLSDEEVILICDTLTKMITNQHYTA